MKIFTLAVLLVIVGQDLRSRAIHWWLLPLLFLGLTLVRLQGGDSLPGVLNSLVINLAFVTIQLVLLTVYFSFKKKKLVNITRGLLGWGDVLFLVCLAGYFSLLNFVLFYLTSLLLALLVTLTDRARWKQVPLAGFQGLALMLLLVFVWYCRPLNLCSDDWLLRFWS